MVVVVDDQRTRSPGVLAIQRGLIKWPGGEGWSEAAMVRVVPLAGLMVACDGSGRIYAVTVVTVTS